MLSSGFRFGDVLLEGGTNHYLRYGPKPMFAVKHGASHEMARPPSARPVRHRASDHPGSDGGTVLTADGDRGLGGRRHGLDSGSHADARDPAGRAADREAGHR